jgi:hypothetical protein
MYQGASEQVTWTVSGLMSYCNLAILDTDDYITFEIIGFNSENVPIDVIYQLKMPRLYKTIDSAVIAVITEELKTLTNDTIQFLKTDQGFSQFIGVDTLFSITNMSYRMKLALGFYYVSKWPLLSEANWNTGIEEITAKAIGYNLSTPMWYVLSNLGSPNQVSHEFNPYTSSNPPIVMRIMNSFVNEQPLSYNNSDFITTTQASSLSNIRCEVVDANMQPIRFLNPIYLTISVKGIPMEQKQPTEEALALRPVDGGMKQALLERKIQNAQSLMDNLISRAQLPLREPVYGSMNVEDRKD